MKAQDASPTTLCADDAQFLTELRTTAAALLDGPSRWDKLHDEILEAKNRRLHKKLRLKWSEFLQHLGIKADDWSRIMLAVEICRLLRGAGLVLPKNHTQVEQLRTFRDNPEGLIAFWKRCLDLYGGVPPAWWLEIYKTGTIPTTTPRREPPPATVGPNLPRVASEMVSFAESYLRLVSQDELFAAQEHAQKLAALVLGRSIEFTTSWRHWPVPPATSVRQLEFQLDDVRKDVLPNLRVPRRISAAPTDQLEFNLTSSDADSRSEGQEFRGIRGNSDAPDASAGAPASERVQTSSDDLTAAAIQTSSQSALNEITTEVSRTIELPTEFRLHGAKFQAELILNSTPATIRLTIHAGTSRWQTNCPTPPRYIRHGAADDGIITFEKRMPEGVLPEFDQEVDFAVKYLTSGGNLPVLQRFAPSWLVDDALALSASAAAASASTGKECA